jgi:hypothetical protein
MQRRYTSLMNGFLALLLLIGSPALAWWNCDWEYRFAANVAKPPGLPPTDYQVRLALTAANVPAQFDWGGQGADLRLIDQDDLTELDFLIESWNAGAQTAVVWAKVPLIPLGGRTIYVYFGGPPGAPAASTLLTFTESGLKFHTKNTAANPANRAAAEAAFAAAPATTDGYGCDIITAYENVNNVGINSPPNRNSNIGLFAEALFEVTPAQAGVWQFRYGADFGRGGGLYVDDIALDEKWNTDLWWNFNWNNAAELLQGSINLAPGIHTFRILGFEDCCDGGLTAQFQAPGGGWQVMSLANIPLYSRKCPITSEPTVTFGPVETGGCPDLTVTRTSQVLEDPMNSTLNPKAIPGATIVNVTTVTNSGPGTVDAGSFFVTEIIAADAALRVANFDGATSGPVQFTDGVPASGLTYTFASLGDAGDDLAFSNNGGASFAYTPVPDVNGVDTTVTHLRISPKNVLAGNAGGNKSVTFSFKTVVQ